MRRIPIFILIPCVLIAFQQEALAYWQKNIVWENGTGNYACYRIPAIIKAPDGSLLAFAEGRVDNCADFGNVDILWFS